MSGRAEWHRLSLLARYVLTCTSVFAIAGAIGGLIRGLFVHPATAWFAPFELGVPCAWAGCIVGLVLTVLHLGIRRVRRLRS